MGAGAGAGTGAGGDSAKTSASCVAALPFSVDDHKGETVGSSVASIWSGDGVPPAVGEATSSRITRFSRGLTSGGGDGSRLGVLSVWSFSGLDGSSGVDVPGGRVDGDSSGWGENGLTCVGNGRGRGIFNTDSMVSSSPGLVSGDAAGGTGVLLEYGPIDERGDSGCCSVTDGTRAPSTSDGR